MDGVNQVDLKVAAGQSSALLTGTFTQTATVVTSAPPCTGGPGVVRTWRADVRGEKTS